MRALYIFAFSILFSLINSCASDETVDVQPFVIAFEKQSYDMSTIESDQQIKLVFSEKATAGGSVTVKYSAVNAAYDTDFSTFPKASELLLEIPFTKGQQEVSFTYLNLIYPYDSDDKRVLFEIVSINYSEATAIQGYKNSLLSFEPSLGGVVQPEIGGPNQGNQVYVDLSTNKQTLIRRDSWDLGFFCGDEPRVVINGSVYMAVKQLEASDIDAVTLASVQQYQSQVSVGTIDPTNTNYVDSADGNILHTAIAAVSGNDSENKVYLVNLGYTIGTDNPAPGSVAVAGSPRGWKKIRILKNAAGYLLQYANLNSTTHQEVAIEKNSAYNFTFFSFNSNSAVSVEPEKAKWDLNFTVFTNEIAGSGSYGYSDFVINNLKAGVKAYQVATSAFSYESFSKANILENNFVDDQRVIGADWRDVFTGSAFTDRFYVLKDFDGNYYKIRMLEFLNSSGIRGYPKFEYQLLP